MEVVYIIWINILNVLNTRKVIATFPILWWFKCFNKQRFKCCNKARK